MRVGPWAIVLSVLAAPATLSAAQPTLTSSALQAAIEPQPLAKALQAWARQSGVQVMYATRLATGLSSPGAPAGLPPQEALRHILSGTGLEYRIVNERTISVMPVEPADKRGAVAASGDSPLQLAQAEHSGLDSLTQPASTSARRAQEQDERARAAQVPSDMLEVVVTGSKIRQTAGTSTSPLQILDQDYIERTGAATTGDLIQSLPQNAGSSTTTQFYGGYLAAPQGVNLRGLGDGTTLILINGRRITPSAASQSGANSIPSFNLNVIPLAAIGRAEVVLDGASAIYGADAVGGVVNLILKDDFQGLEGRARYTDVASGTVNELSASLVGGASWGPVDLLLGVDYYDRGAMMGGEFERGRTLDYSRWGGTDLSAIYPFLLGPVPATVSSLDGGNLPGLTSSFAAIPRGQDGTALTPADFLDTQGTRHPGVPFTAFYTLWPEQTRKSVFGHARSFVADNVEWQLAGGYSSMDTSTSARFPVSGLPVAAANPYNPFGVDVLVDFYQPPIPTQTRTTDAFLMSSLAGPAWGDLRYEIGINANRSKLQQQAYGVDFAGLMAALNASTPSAAFNIFGDPSSNDAALERGLMVLEIDDAVRLDMLALDLGLQGDVVSGERFRLSLASGAELRTESFATEHLDASRPHVDEDRDVTALYTELLARGVRMADERFLLTLSAAARYEEYSDFGGKVVPKLGLRIQPTPAVGLRASYGRSFKAPSLTQLSTPRVVSPSPAFIIDRKLGQSYAIGAEFGGNPELGPEMAKNFSAGLLFDLPFGKNVTVGLDYFRVDFSERIFNSPFAQFYVDLEDAFPDLVTRDPVTQRVTQVSLLPVNVAAVRTSGWDVSLNAEGSAGPVDIGISNNTAFIDEYRVRNSTLEPFHNDVNIRNNPVRFKNTTNLYAQWGGWRASTVIRHTGGYRDIRPLLTPIDSLTTVDLNASYTWDSKGFGGPLARWLDGTTATFAVYNVGDESPPFVDQFYGYDYAEGDVRGRVLAFEIKRSW